MKLFRWLRTIYDRHFLLATVLYILAYCAGALIVGGQDHHGAWEWAGWTCLGLSLIFVQVVTEKLRKGRKS